MPADVIRKYFERSRIFNISSSDSTGLYGYVDNKPIDYAKHGFSTGAVPMYIIGAPCSYNVDVKIKDGKYQITIYNAVFNPPMAGFMMRSSNVQMTLNEASYNYNRNKFKSAFFSMNAAAVLATVWYDLFSIKSEEDTTTSDDW